MRSAGALGALLIVSSVGLLAGCGSDDNSEFPDGGTNTDGGAQCEPFCNPGQDANIVPGDGGIPGPCVNLQCKQVTCQGSATTSVSGIVYDPAGKVPLYNVIGYVPNKPGDPITHGATCDKCGQVSGSPVVSTLTNTKGEFVLKNVPVGTDIPLVIQVGKWRRQIKLPNVDACKDTPLAKADTHMPRNKSEGDIPYIALTTGGADPLECLPRKMGLDVAEFTNVGGTGSVHLYKGVGGSQLDAQTTGVATFWNSDANLKKYDMVMLGCEGGEHNENKGAPAFNAMKAYADAGGRVLGTHYHYTWLENGPADFKSTATFNHGGNPPNPTDGYIDDSFPKGKAFAEWMSFNGPLKSNPPPIFSIKDPRRDVTTIATDSTRWVFNTAQNATYYYSFNTPVGIKPENQCGKIVFSDLHVSSGDSTGGTFPGNCTTTDLSPQEKALEFLLFDLSSCIQDDKLPPPNPPIGPN
ncbi:hypothetical protein BH09MYX1_BH09MYX1_55920 [soil metagenome]